jgi:hypothetical protein
VLPFVCVAVSVTAVPKAKPRLQLPVAAVDDTVQLSPAGLETTVPLPVPIDVTISTGDAPAVKAAVTLRAWVIATWQVLDPEHAPDQPAKVLPFAAAAVSVTVAPEA